jgi:class 3 adenylate cyclase
VKNDFLSYISNKWRIYLTSHSLRFASDSDESEFALSYIDSTAITTQIFMAIGGITFLLYVSVDKLIDPLGYFTANAIRFYYSTPLIFLCVFLIFFPYFRKKIEYIVVVNGFIIISAQAVIFSTLELGYNYAAPGFAIMFLIRAITYIIRITYLLFIALFSLIGVIGGHIIADNSGNGWIIVNTIGILTAITLGMVAALARERRARAQFVANRALGKSRARAEALVGSLLPGTMIERIRAGEKNIADILEEVSIVFADIADFTLLSRRLSPTDLIRLLDDIFSRFDRAAELWGMEKITTVGDAYMAVGGMHYPEKRRDIAMAAVQFALEIRKEIAKVIAETGYPINLRIGVHIGPVVVGVVGDRRPTFDCWGDSIRTASTLEGQAAIGAILISDPVFEALNDIAKVGHMQKITVKDVAGEISAYELRSLHV